MQTAILYLIALVLSITVHEFGHAWMATKLGDSLPRLQGRLTLSPARHIDPVGTLLVPLLAHLWHAPMFGWGKPVETVPANYTRRFTMTTGHMMVAAAGPAMNLLMATFVSTIVVVGVRTGLLSQMVAGGLIDYLVVLNVWLMLFNLLPIPPLDGGTVLAGLLPRSMHGPIEFLQRFGFIVLLAIMLIPPVSHAVLGPISMVAQAWKQQVITMALGL
jgi:Zn-dependent protease